MSRNNARFHEETDSGRRSRGARRRTPAAEIGQTPPATAGSAPSAAKAFYPFFQGFTSSSVHSIVFSRQAVPCRRSCVSFVATSARKARQILPSIG